MGAARVCRGKIARTVPAKITSPEITGYFPRKRLFRLLDAARKRLVVWISASPGSGKTTLVSSYIDVRRLPRLWYQVDERDADVATFFYYMGLAAQQAAPRKRKPMLLLTPEYLPGLPVFTRRFFDELFTRLPAPSVVVFDNYQKIPPESMLHGVIRDAAACLPPKVNLFLVSRSAPPPAFAEMRANRLSSIIGWEEMRLTGEETRGIARLHTRRSFRGEEIRRLEESADGWVAGLVLMLEKDVAEGVMPDRKGIRTPEEIIDYFGGEVFEQVDPDTRSFLLSSSFLPRMTAEMAQRLTGYARAAEILSALCRNNWFTQAHGHAVPVYEYHSLFREFLLSRARAALPASEIRRLQRSAAVLLAEKEQVEDAAALLRECGDWDGLAHIVLSLAPSLAGQGRYRVLEEWLQALPPAVVESAPWLRYWMGVCRMPFHPGESKAHFELALQAFLERGDAPGTFLSWSGIVESIIFGYLDIKSLNSRLSAIEEVIGRSEGFPSKEIEGRILSSMVKAINITFGGAVRPGESVLVERALEMARTTSNAPLKIDLLLSLAYYLQGRDFRKMGMVLHMLRVETRRRDVPPMARLSLYWQEATHSILGGAHDACLKAVTEGLAHAAGTGVRFLDFILTGHGALSSMITGDVVAAKNFLGKMSASLGSVMPLEAGLYYYLAAWEELGAGEPVKALLLSERCLKLCEEVGFCWTMHLAHLQRAVLFFEVGAGDEAAAHLRLAREVIPGGRGEYSEFVCLLAEAYFLMRKGEEEAALKPLREGLRKGRESGIGGVYLWHPNFLKTVFSKALQAGIEEEYVLGLIRKNRLVPDPSAPDLEKWPWPVKVYTLGRFSLVVDGKVLPPARKTRQKPLLLLKALIALGGREVPEEQLTEILWPDADGDLAHQSLAKTLERLREMLGDDLAVLLRDGRLTLNNRHCWVDVWEFERTLGRADAARKPGAHAPEGGEVARLAERAIAMYCGTFLFGETFCSCIVTYRERLRSKFLRTVVQAGRHWEKAEEWEKAIACYQKGLEVDPLSEEMYLGLISCNMRTGRAAEANAVYQRCCRTLSSVLGVSPSPDLQVILKSAPAVPTPGRK
jgi:DNA-binding SARP family transcriptional activator